MKARNLLKKPYPIRKPREERNPDRYCEHHDDIGHTTEECRDLKKSIDSCIRAGKLDEVIDRSKHNESYGGKRRNYDQDRDRGREGQKHRERSPAPGRDKGNYGPDRYEENRPDMRVGTIFGEESQEVNSVGELTAETESPRKQIRLTTEVIYGPRDEVPTGPGYGEGLVIEVVIKKALVSRVCVDNGSAVNVLYYSTFKAMKLNEKELTPVASPLFGFTGHAVHTMGSIRLLTTVGDGERGRTLMLNFLVVKASSAYNAILGRPTLYELRAVISTYHNSMKFPTRYGSHEVRGDSEIAKQCNAITLKGKMQVQQVILSKKEKSVEASPKCQLWKKVCSFINEEKERCRLAGRVPT